MEVSNQSNNYQMQSATKPENSIQPIKTPTEPTVKNGPLYEASNGNLINSDEGITLTPQGELNVENKQAQTAAQTQAQTQATRDSQREYAADSMSKQSKQSQVEIYLAVAKESGGESEGSATASILESLRDVQKQNNQVDAYATYAQNQQGGTPALY